MVGLIPTAGPSKAVILLFAVVNYFDFPTGNYLFVLFSISTVVSCSIGDSFAGILLGIPGAGGAAASMMDGYPLTKQGKASYALSAGLFTSTVQGLLFGMLGIMIIPYYKVISHWVSVPEIFAMCLLSFALISSITNKYTLRSLLAVVLGLTIGSIGVDSMEFERLTFGIDYLYDGIPVVVVAAGLFALPEMVSPKIIKPYIGKQTMEGIRVALKYKWLGLQGGLIGFLTGILPGTGGGIGDWASYSATIARNPDEEFGNGNIKGVIGTEGANNSGKMGALLPTIMFGIPGNKMYAIMMALWLYVGFEVGDPNILDDDSFIHHLVGGYMLGTLFAGVFMIIFAKKLSSVVHIRHWQYPMTALVIWGVLSSQYYIDVPQNLIALALFGILGWFMKRWYFSRPALLLAFILCDRFEKSWLQMEGIYFYGMDKYTIWIDRPLFTILMISVFVILFYGIKAEKHAIR